MDLSISLKKKVFAIIPARSGSKGVPNKNIRELKGHTLLEWSIKACQKSKFIDQIFLSTDSSEYRDLEISKDTSTDYEMVDHFLNFLTENGDIPDYLVHIRPTTPLRDPRIIDEAILSFLTKPQSTALRSVHLMNESAHKTFEIAMNGILKPIFSEETDLDHFNKPRQTFPNTYVANGYVDVLSCKYIKESKCFHGNKVMPFLTPNTSEIDSEEDFVYSKFLIEQNPEIFNNLFL